MTDIAIAVEHLGKSYLVGHKSDQRERYTALRDVLARNVRGLIRKTGDMIHGRPIIQGDEVEEFWALKDVSFEVRQGETLGIIGRNGAGKSTLLKILSRITEPTQGRVTLNGRVASLLEVGTGFHPELTGRENIFLNGAILGMKRAEIRRKFDEIVAFAEVEKFLDTPVKRYSSGMYVRLAFAVAAHLEPEILVVDEVLAVGDAAFQAKCLGKMGDVAREGRTVLFVSHQMAAIQRLCNRAAVLSRGTIKAILETRPAIDIYLGDADNDKFCNDLSALYRTGAGEVVLSSFHLENSNGQLLGSAASGETLIFVFGYQCLTGAGKTNVSIGFSIHGALNETLVVLYSDYVGISFNLQGKGKIRCRIDDFPFSLGRYHVGARITASGIEQDWPRGFIGTINVEAGDFYGDGSLGHSGIGPVLLRGKWSRSPEL